jgi:cytochrome c oxidase cbb3-type subunit 3
MPAWDALLKPEEIQQVAIYVASMKGSNPPNPKAPQGTKVGN